MDFVKIKLLEKITGRIVSGYLYSELDHKISISDNGMIRSWYWTEVQEISRKVVDIHAKTECSDRTASE